MEVNINNKQPRNRNQKRKNNRNNKNKNNNKPRVVPTVKKLNIPAKNKKPMTENRSNRRTVTRVNQNSQKNSALVRFVQGSLEFSPVVMPRPVPMPTASYVFQKTIELNSAPPLTDYSGLIEVYPNLDSQIILTTNDYDANAADFITTSYTIDAVVTATYYARDNADILEQGKHVALVPPLARNGQPGTTVKYWSAIITGWATANPSIYSYVPNYRNISQLERSKGATPYINVTAKSNQATIKYILTINGNFDATPKLTMYEFSAPNIAGNILASTPFVITGEPTSHSVTFTLTKAFEDDTESIVYVLENVSVISLLQWRDGGVNTDGHVTTVKLEQHRRIISIQPAHEEQVFSQVVEASSGYAITGLAATITNTSAQTYQGGTCVAALIPAEVQTPLNYDGFYTIVSERPYYRYLGLARTGAHAVWVPERVADLQMMHKSRYLESNRLIIGFKSAPSNTATPSWKLVVSWRVEFQVNSMILPSRIPPSSTEFLPALFAGIREHLDYLYGENPTHRQRIKDVAKKIAKSPQFKNVAKQLGNAAIQGLVSMATKSLAAL